MTLPAEKSPVAEKCISLSMKSLPRSATQKAPNGMTKFLDSGMKPGTESLPNVVLTYLPAYS